MPLDQQLFLHFIYPCTGSLGLDVFHNLFPTVLSSSEPRHPLLIGEIGTIPDRPDPEAFRCGVSLPESKFRLKLQIRI
jgi:hypothetical protein